jgi:hypothetical protein
MIRMELPLGLWPLFLRVGSADPERLIVRAQEEGLLPLMLFDASAPARVRDVASRSVALRALSEARTRLQFEAAARFVSIVGADACLFFKGFDARHRLYERPELRPSADIDVLVPRNRIRGALMRLREAGYPQVRSSHGVVWAPGIYEVAVDIDEVRVEIHRSMGHAIRASVDYEEVWSESLPLHAGTIEARCLRPAHAIAAQALNLAKDEFAGGMVRFLDLWLMLRQWPEAIEESIEVARRWSVRRALYGALTIVTRMFPDADSDVIRRARASLGNGRVRAFLDRRVLPDRSLTPSGHGDGRLIQLWRKAWLTDTAWRRAAFLGYHAFLVASGAAAEAFHRREVDRYRAEKVRAA